MAKALQYIFNLDPKISPKLFLSMIFHAKKVSESFRSWFHPENMFMINYNLKIVTKVSTNDLFNIFLSFFFLTANWRVVVAGKNSF